jgi:hypothetical protein
MTTERPQKLKDERADADRQPTGQCQVEAESIRPSQSSRPYRGPEFPCGFR